MSIHLNRPPKSVVLVLNARFVPAGRNSPYLYGAVQHAIRTADLLSAEGIHVGFLLYLRDEERRHPHLDETLVLGQFSALIIRFNFKMSGHALSSAFNVAMKRLRSKVSPAERERPLIYFQSSALLPYTPDGHEVAITHHGPFVCDVIEILGEEGASRAFDWDHAKTASLASIQRAGLAALAARESYQCLEISGIQETFLKNNGIAANRIHRLPQPLQSDGTSNLLPPPQVRDFVAKRRSSTRGVFAVTAVSRFDFFKNVDLMIEGTQIAVESGDLDGVIVIGGSVDDPHRDRLRRSVPAGLSKSYLFMEKIPRQLLVNALFPYLARNTTGSIFVCSSRYDLVPYTALEAARSGLCTIAPSGGLVGASEYLPIEYQFCPTPSGLASRISALTRDDSLFLSFRMVAESICKQTNDEAFMEAFLSHCFSV